MKTTNVIINHVVDVVVVVVVVVLDRTVEKKVFSVFASGPTRVWPRWLAIELVS